MALTAEAKQLVRAHASLALKLLAASRAAMHGTSTESDLRTGFSRLYYAFYHVGVAFLVSIGVEAEHIEHGRLPVELERALGKYTVGHLVRELYEYRRQADYEPAMFITKYNGELGEARQDAILLIKRAHIYFKWLHFTALERLTGR